MATNQQLTLDQQIRAVSQALDAMVSSVGPADLCRHIVHAGFADGLVRGCSIFFLDNKSNLVQVASYGQSIGVEAGFSAWDDTILSEAVREKDVRTGPMDGDSKGFSVLALPFIANGVPVGLVAMAIDDGDLEVQIPQELANLISKLGAFYLDTLDFGNISKANLASVVNPEDLTTRQLTILGYIEDGLVNLEIAKVLMLSESTIRQETVRIYRALGVANRQEAVKKAKALGLLAKKVSDSQLNT